MKDKRIKDGIVRSTSHTPRRSRISNNFPTVNGIPIYPPENSSIPFGPSPHSEELN